EGLATQVLLDRASGAELLVLGGVASTGRDAIGPVARDCLRHPPCPIVVVSWEKADVPVPVGPAGIRESGLRPGGHEDAERVAGRVGVDAQRLLGIAGAVEEQAGGRTGRAQRRA